MCWSRVWYLKVHRQISYLKRFSPMWLRSCQVSKLFKLKILSHKLHLNTLPQLLILVSCNLVEHLLENNHSIKALPNCGQQVNNLSQDAKSQSIKDYNCWKLMPHAYWSSSLSLSNTKAIHWRIKVTYNFEKK